ncbi:MAG: hypothetical protein AB7O62_11170 [Pirellulales bacterium]
MATGAWAASVFVEAAGGLPGCLPAAALRQPASASAAIANHFQHGLFEPDSRMPVRDG